MSSIILQKKRRFRQDSTNPYRSRYLVFSLHSSERKYFIEARQEDYVLKSLVASQTHCTPELPSEHSARQLVEYMLENARAASDILIIYEQWQEGKITLIRENGNMLVREAIRKRFARNLKKF